MFLKQVGFLFCLSLASVLFASQAAAPPDPAVAESQETCNQILEKLKSTFIEPSRVFDAIKSDWHRALLLELDPTHHYFLQEDYEYFTALEAQLPHDTIDFDFAKSVQARWIQRIDTAKEVTDHWLAQAHDFTADEVIEIRYETFARSQDELNDRWRKRIKRELLGDKLSGLLNDDSPELLRNRYRMIFEKQWTVNDDELLSRFINVLLKRIEPHALYLTADELLDFEVGHVRPYQWGLRREMIDDEWQITGVAPFFADVVGSDLAAKVIGMRLISLKANNTELVFFSKDRRSWWSVSGLHPDHQELGKAKSVTLELRDPYSRRRMEIQWPRLRIRLNRQSNQYEAF